MVLIGSDKTPHPLYCKTQLNTLNEPSREITSIRIPTDFDE